METLKVRTRTGVAKLVEVVICLGGVATLAFYKGPHFKFLCFFKHLLKGQNQHPATSSSSHKSWAKGCFLMLSSNFTWSIWLVFQTIIMKSYPSKLMFTALQCLQSSIQSLVVAVAVERDLEEWKLGWNMRLLAVTYCGVVVNGVTYYLLAWVLEKKGPVFVVITTPLTFIFTMLCSALLCYSIPLGRYFFFYFGNIGDVPLLCTLVSNMHIYYFLHRKYHRPQ
ncbi:unnamed protein product [Linum tenue]|nr:unnamed protein product [Linum tenue]